MRDNCCTRNWTYCPAGRRNAAGERERHTGRPNPFRRDQGGALGTLWLVPDETGGGIIKGLAGDIDHGGTPVENRRDKDWWEYLGGVKEAVPVASDCARNRQHQQCRASAVAPHRFCYARITAE